MKALIDIISLFIFLSFLLVFYLNLLKTKMDIENQIKIASNEIKCRAILIDLKFENLSEEELSLLEQINKVSCNFSQFSR
jgi:hypothetical protein